MSLRASWSQLTPWDRTCLKMNALLAVAMVLQEIAEHYLQ